MAETIANNVRSKIIKEHLNDPAFYDKMSALLKEILDDLKAQADQLRGIPEADRRAGRQDQCRAGTASGHAQANSNTPGKRALYNNLPEPKRPQRCSDGNESTARAGAGDRCDRQNSRPDNWRGNQAKENVIKAALLPLLDYDEDEVERIFPVIIAQTEY